MPTLIAPSNGPHYTMRAVCGASALLNKGGPTLLDAIGILPAIGELGKGIQVGIQLAQHGAVVGSLALTVSGGSSPADAFLTGTSTGLTVVDDAKVLTEAAELVPVVGNFVSAFATGRDIFGKEGLVNYYNDCLAGKN